MTSAFGWSLGLWGAVSGAAHFIVFRHHPQRTKLVRTTVSFAHCLAWWWLPAPPLLGSMAYYAGDLLHMLLCGQHWPTMVAHHGMSLLLLNHALGLPGGDNVRRTVEHIFWLAEMSNLPGTLVYGSMKLWGRSAPVTQKLLGVQLLVYTWFRSYRISKVLITSPWLWYGVPRYLLPCWLIWPMGLWWSGKLCADVNR